MTKQIPPELEIFIRNHSDKERSHSDLKYSIKLVEKIVFYAVGAMAIAVLGAMIKLVIL